jgi:hypothetical protein
MVFDLFNLSRIASAAITLKPIAKMVSAMATVQSNLSANQSSTSPIELADRTQRRLFAAYVIILVVSALIVALFTYLVWRAGNTYQDTVKTDAYARIAEAGSSAAQANERAAKADERAGEANSEAGRANERAQNLEHDNLTLRGQVATLEKQAVDAKKDVASLQKAAADAKAAQQRVETELARQQERAANAERALEIERIERLRLEEAIAPRNIVSMFVMVDALKKYTGKKAIIEYLDEDEPRRLAQDVSSTLGMAGWSVTMKPDPKFWETNIFVMFPGLRLPMTQEMTSTDEAAILLIQHLQADKLEVYSRPTATLPPDTIRIAIGRKESSYLALKRYEEVHRDFIFGEPTDPILEPLQEQIRVTHFTEEQQRLFIERVKKSIGTTSVQVRCPAEDNDTCEFATEIGALLHRAGWQIQNNSIMRDKGFPSMTSLAYIFIKYPEFIGRRGFCL